jgi:predicted AlkP superfamily phosphohydrolase/phosphomutase
VRLLVIGLDGATFDRLKPWMEAGYMETIGSLVKEGAWGPLKSTLPPVTAPAWSTFATGLNPGRHGVFNFSQISWEKPGERILCDSRNVHGVRFWNVLNRAGARTGIVDLPMFSPPEEIQGFMVSDVIASGWKKALTYPRHLKKDLEAALPDAADIMARPLTNGVASSPAYLKKMISSLESKEALDLQLLRSFPCDVFVTVYSHTDVFQHHFWHVLDGSHPFYDVRRANRMAPLVEKFIRRLDAAVRRLIEASRCRTVILISDHGFGPARKVVYVNTLLHSLGYLHLRSSGFHNKSLTPRKVKSMANALDLFGFRKFISKGLRQNIANFLRKTLFPEIDWNKTRAHFAMQADYGLWINRKSRVNPNGAELTEAEYENLRGELVKDLKKARDPVNGALLFDGAYLREEVFTGPYVEYAPDVMVEPAFGYMASSDFSTEVTGNQSPGLVSGCHRREGIFVAWGPDIRKGNLPQARIEDAAPTLLYLSGAPIPEGLDGSVLDVVIPSHRKAHPLAFFDASGMEGYAGTDQPEISDEDEQAAMERLRSLGYLQ